MKTFQIYRLGILLIAFLCLNSCYKKYNESMTYASHTPIPTLLPNMDIEWERSTTFQERPIVEATIQNDLEKNVINSGIDSKKGKVVVSINEISDSLCTPWILWGLLDMYMHTIMGIPFCTRHVHVQATFTIWNQNKAIARYSYRGTAKRVLGIYYTKDSKTAIVEATRNILSDLHCDINREMSSLTAQLNPTKMNRLPATSVQKEETIDKNLPDVDINIPVTQTKNSNTFVVVYANEDYKRLEKVPYAKQDGKVFAEYCVKTLGIPKENIHVVENATLNEMQSEIYWLSQVCDAFNGNAKVIVYYSGHGIPSENEKSAYLLPVDGDGTRVESGYKLDDLYSSIEKLSSSMVCVFIDACFSGMRKDGEALVPARGVALKAKPSTPQGNMVVFSAAQGDETAYPNNDEQHGMFTYYLLKKLQETKGDVTLQDLGNYITTNVRQQSIVKNGKSQTPCVTPSVTLDASWQNWKLK